MENIESESLLVYFRRCFTYSSYLDVQARRIREGEELFIDYGPVFFKDKSNIIVDLEATGS